MVGGAERKGRRIADPLGVRFLADYGDAHIRDRRVTRGVLDLIELTEGIVLHLRPRR